METGRFKVAWWNTRLTPPKGSPMGEKDRAIILQTVNSLLSSGIDILGLGEVGDADVDQITLLVGTEFAVRRFIVTDVGRRFHMCLIVRKDAVVVHAASAFTKNEGRRTFRIAVWASCVVGDLAFELYLVHWPSRLYAQQEGFERHFFGYALREEIDQKIRSGRANVIVIGDFNDEPYNISMNDRLLATRDPSIARNKPDVLYNPFWKRMAPSIGHVPNSSQEDQFGSYFFNQNALVKWHALDQILVSGTFLGALHWHLLESETDVYRTKELFDHVSSSKSLIDHLPVIGTFVRY